MMRSLSIIIPTYNEAGNIKQLIQEIDKVLRDAHIQYEVIIIDDHSTDGTVRIGKRLSNHYPIRVELKEGKPGKSYSLLQGFKKARYNTIAMIDGDLQYPPTALVPMIKKIEAGADIVVANRREQHTKLTRLVASRTFRTVFGKWLHDLDCDVQSGLKVFKRVITQRIKVNPSPWTFDLEFLIKARHAGYSIDSIDILYEKRTYGKTKVKFLQASYEIAVNAVKLKFTAPEIIPLLPHNRYRHAFGFHHHGKKYIPFTGLPIKETALFNIFGFQKKIALGLVSLLLISLILNPQITMIVVIALLTILYFSDSLFNLVLVAKNLSRPPELKVSSEQIAQLTEKNLPQYTILCPLYKEWSVLPQFIEAIKQLDYPKEKLQVLLLLEQDDLKTIEVARTTHLPKYFEVVVVPHSNPKTKPKACNYALTKVKGEYCVIYDAEDMPEPDQLKKVVYAFSKSLKKVICIQAKLDFYNPHQNLLTKLFTAEYSLWFNLTLPGLQTLNAPIPLGGTSNHFRTQQIKELGGWDAFNVAEDCDLGIRLAKKGYRTAIVDSVTHEEANSHASNWFWQRTRWIKGYIQTLLVHSREPKVFAKQSWAMFFMFVLNVGGKILALYVNPLMWLMTLSYFVFRPILAPWIESLFPPIIFYMAAIALVVGNFLYFYYYMIGAAKRGHFEIIKYGFIVPIYWLAMSTAAWVALYKLITAPHQWSKTIHGLHLHSKPTSVTTVNKPAIQPTYSV